MVKLGFWKDLKKPIFSLAPMADVTDPAFRRIVAKYGKPAVLWTEFVSADGLMRADKKGKEKLLKNLIYSESERPIVAQFFTSDPEAIRYATNLAVKLGFDGVDINMGCPDRSVEKQGAGAALIKNPKLAQKLISSAKEAVEEAGSIIPISVKTRIGYNKNEIRTWIPALLEAEPSVITVHLRTRKQMSKTSADWNIAKEIIEIRNKQGSETLVFGNGDVESLEHAKQLVKETGVDGVMLGRAIFSNPYLFSNSAEYWNKFDQESIKRRLKILVEHTELFEKILGDSRNFSIMKKQVPDICQEA